MSYSTHFDAHDCRGRGGPLSHGGGTHPDQHVAIAPGTHPRGSIDHQPPHPDKCAAKEVDGFDSPSLHSYNKGHAYAKHGPGRPGVKIGDFQDSLGIKATIAPPYALKTNPLHDAGYYPKDTLALAKSLADSGSIFDTGDTSTSFDDELIASFQAQVRIRVELRAAEAREKVALATGEAQAAKIVELQGQLEAERSQTLKAGYHTVVSAASTSRNPGAEVEGLRARLAVLTRQRGEMDTELGKTKAALHAERKAGEKVQGVLRVMKYDMDNALEAKAVAELKCENLQMQVAAKHGEVAMWQERAERFRGLYHYELGRASKDRDLKLHTEELDKLRSKVTVLRGQRQEYNRDIASLQAAARDEKKAKQVAEGLLAVAIEVDLAKALDTNKTLQLDNDKLHLKVRSVEDDLQNWRGMADELEGKVEKLEPAQAAHKAEATLVQGAEQADVKKLEAKINVLQRQRKDLNVENGELTSSLGKARVAKIDAERMLKAFKEVDLQLALDAQHALEVDKVKLMRELKNAGMDRELWRGRAESLKAQLERLKIPLDLTPVNKTEAKPSLANQVSKDTAPSVHTRAPLAQKSNLDNQLGQAKPNTPLGPSMIGPNKAFTKPPTYPSIGAAPRGRDAGLQGPFGGQKLASLGKEHPFPAKRQRSNIPTMNTSGMCRPIRGGMGMGVAMGGSRGLVPA
ncbi:hypothetical protein IAT38_004025 [Cryptococcus sp. DSM 104549]